MSVQRWLAAWWGLSVIVAVDWSDGQEPAVARLDVQQRAVHTEEVAME